MILAFIKLRKRNLGPILDANGWAVNAKAKMNVPFGASLTQIATLPPGSQRDLVDPFADKKSPWPPILVVLAILAALGACWYYGKLDKVLPPGANSISMFGGTNAPAFQKYGTNAAGWKLLGTSAPAYRFISRPPIRLALTNLLGKMAVSIPKPGGSPPGFLFAAAVANSSHAARKHRR